MPGDSLAGPFPLWPYGVSMKTVILAGGLGTRLSEETGLRPKPMVEIGGKPILWHILKQLAHHDLREFVIALGYKAEFIKRYFLDYSNLNADFSVELRTGQVERHAVQSEDWTIRLIDTGLETITGGRLKRLADLLRHETFMVTYGDGVSNVDVRKLLAFHRSHGKLATVTAVRPPARFGSLIFGEGQGPRVVEFAEKPTVGEGWINGGYFVLEPGVLDYIAGDATHFEREPLENLARDGQLMAFHHEGFWQSMDTLRDVHLLESLWASGRAPWKIWT